MAVKQTIAIIGAAGKLGSALAKRLLDAYRLLLFDSDTAKLEQLTEQMKKNNPHADIECSCCPVEASWEADVIIPAVPFTMYPDLIAKIRKVATQKIVISVSSGLTESAIQEHKKNWSMAEVLQQDLPYSKVVKAFNTVPAIEFERPENERELIDVFIAGNDAEAVYTVESLVRVTGFHPVYAGPLPVSRTLENLRPGEQYKDFLATHSN